MARLNDEQVLGMLFDDDFDSGGESDIEEDPAFPLPQPEDIEHTPSPQPTVGEGDISSPSTVQNSGSESEDETEGLRTRGRGRGHRRWRGRGRGRGRGSQREREKARETLHGSEPQQEVRKIKNNRHNKMLHLNIVADSETSRLWIEVDPSSDLVPPSLPFSETTGPQLPAMTSQTPADFFHLIFSNEVLDMLVRETNR